MGKTVDLSTEILSLDSKLAFESLSEREKLYAYHLYQASNVSLPIVVIQRSVESMSIIKLFSRFFEHILNQQTLTDGSTNNLTDIPLELLVYVCQLFSCCGNYNPFGKYKFIPDVGQQQMESILSATSIWSELEPLWLSVKDQMYSYEPQDRQLDFSPDGKSSYYSPGMTKDKAQSISFDMSPYNTRLFEVANDDNSSQLELHIASVDIKQQVLPNGLKLCYGDYSQYLTKVVHHLSLAKQYSNELEAKMLDKYIEAFTTGNTQAHVEGSKLWVQNVGPVVETYIGFIESYQDPLGTRGEWEGFVAIVNKDTSQKYATLVNQAQQFISLLPWPREYEKDTFLSPDFTSLEVVTFGTSIIPSGINIPN